MDERVFEVLFKAISAVVGALEPFTPSTADIHRMWHGPRGYFQLSPGGLSRRLDLIRRTLRYGDWSDKTFSFLSRGAAARHHRNPRAGRCRLGAALFAPSSRNWALTRSSMPSSCRSSTSAFPMHPPVPLGGIILHQSDAAFLERLFPGRYPTMLISWIGAVVDDSIDIMTFLHLTQQLSNALNIGLAPQMQLAAVDR